VVEAARNVDATGARPLAVTNCLNFGSPERPEIMGEFAEAVRGLGDACRALGTPVVSGNVSFYNETSGAGAIPPTPTIGMVGLLDDASLAVRAPFAGAGDAIVLLGELDAELGGSEYLAHVHGLEQGPLPELDLARAAGLIDVLVEAAARRLLRSAHDVSDGGLAVALAECAIWSGVGVEVALAGADRRPDALLFGESAACAIASCAVADANALCALAAERGVRARQIGVTGGERVRIEPGIDVAVSDARAVWDRVLPEALDHERTH